MCRTTLVSLDQFPLDVTKYLENTRRMCRTTLFSLDQFPLDVTKCGYNFGVVEVEIIPLFLPCATAECH